ncbi:bile acid:sodium symporter family protein [Macellibacteroides fermentans]|uniref:BASS family bile acid:Na+ symporter n=1 Tax=Macellibacteroides fermentans TaxID=879969 RepID=A0A8E2A5N5_9PORP|nr:transporter [Macellibacteroides fermentans]MBP7920024.1 transporter [Parabacteroides sp.]MBP8012431.1 transporter [Parabacteroides sp.]MBP8026691.1 transporter [Parabacteroides sp.]MDD3256470.1 transporter [Parabacteroides sp.]NYI49376.1 BASS family bile acid:Na+ symporter [Macellibacteroides fermentans]
MLKFIKDWMLPLAMLTGALSYRLVGYISFLTPYLIFTMLLLTFCKLSPREMRLHPLHKWLLLIQLVGCVVVYGLVYLYDPVVAQGALICVLAPTATSAAVITGMLGGSVAFLTNYVLLCNIGVAIMAPVLFSFMGSQSEMPFFESFLFICRQVGPLLILPLVFAWSLRAFLPKLHARILSVHKLSFYLWAVALTIVTGSTVRFLVEQQDPDYTVEIGLAVVSLVICVGQFLLGRRLGKRYGDPVSSGQGLGQKNTILAIWMAQVYLNPIASIAPAAYVLWQNSINSYQLWLKGRKNE